MADIVAQLTRSVVSVVQIQVLCSYHMSLGLNIACHILFFAAWFMDGMRCCLPGMAVGPDSLSIWESLSTAAYNDS